jgi:hypothetical protein
MARMSATARLYVVVLAVGCGSGADHVRNATVERDSAGITVVENEGPYETWQVEPSPVVRIGVVEGDSAYQFHRIAFAGRLSDGRIVVVNGGTREIRWFGPDGLYETGAGRQGQGPGEFETIASVVLTPADTLIVDDPRNQRVTWITPSGTIVREEMTAGLSSGTVTVLGSAPGDAVALAISTPTYDLSHPDVSYTRDTLTVVRVAPARIDTLLRTPGQEGALWVRYSGGRPAAMQQMGLPFAHPLLVAGTGKQILLGRSEGQQLEILDSSAALKTIARRQDQPATRLTQEDRAAYVRRAVDAAQARGQSNTTALEKGLNDLLAVVPENHTLPSFDRLLVDMESRIWLRDYVQPGGEAADQTWTVYQPDGHIRSQVSIPASIEVMHVGRGYLTGVARDSLDVEFVVVHAITGA